MVFHKSYRDGLIRFLDGDAPANAVVVAVAQGDLTIKTPGNEPWEVYDRGKLNTGAGDVKKGDEQSTEWSFSYALEGFLSPTGITPYEVFTNSGAAAAWITTRASSNVFCVNMRFETLDKDGGVEEQVLFNDAFFTSMDTKEGDPSIVTVTGRAFDILPSIT